MSSRRACGQRARTTSTGPRLTGPRWRGCLRSARMGHTAADTTAPARRSRPFPPQRMLIAAAAVAVLAAAAGFWFGRARTPATTWDPANYQLTRVTLNPGVSTQPAISPDGSLIAYTSDQAGNGDLDIWVQQVTGGGAVRLTKNPASDYDPTFSPDGSRIAFRSNRDGGGIYVVAALGGGERLVAERGYQPRYSPDGRDIAYWTGPRNSAGPSQHVSGGGHRRRAAPDPRRVCFRLLPGVAPRRPASAVSRAAKGWSVRLVGRNPRWQDRSPDRRARGFGRELPEQDLRRSVRCAQQRHRLRLRGR